MVRPEQFALDKRQVWIAWALIAAIIVVWQLRSMPSPFADDPVDKCDAAIKARLVAPSTYERVSSTGSEGQVYVTYQAQNALGVPLRNMGICDLASRPVSWTEIGGA